jgi:hypothetical protein
MHQRRLHLYLEDHLALIFGETELISRCLERNHGSELGRYLKHLETDVECQRATVADILRRHWGRISHRERIKQGAAWCAEKMGRLKLNDSLIQYSPLSRLHELEVLLASAQSRIGLWTTLHQAAATFPDLSRCKFESLQEQSEQHLRSLALHHREAGILAFGALPRPAVPK